MINYSQDYRYLYSKHYYKVAVYMCDIWGIYGSIFTCARLPTCTCQVTDTWHQEAHTVAYVITT